jgi:hypothetical protein
LDSKSDGKLDGKLDGTVFTIAVDKHAPSSRTYLANMAGDAVVGQAKNCSPVHLLTGFRTSHHQVFRLSRADHRMRNACAIVDVKAENHWLISLLIRS